MMKHSYFTSETMHMKSGKALFIKIISILGQQQALSTNKTVPPISSGKSGIHTHWQI